MKAGDILPDLFLDPVVMPEDFYEGHDLRTVIDPTHIIKYGVPDFKFCH